MEITDANANVLIVLEFEQFEFNHNLSADDFDMQRNMTSWNLQSLPAMSEEAILNKGRWTQSRRGLSAS